MVAGRKKVGLLFSYSEKWIGGSYYFMNLVNALAHLDDDKRPHIVVVSENESDLDILKKTGYPYLSYTHSESHYNIAERIINKLSRAIGGKSLIQKSFSKETFEVLFGYYEELFRLAKCRKIYWIPDLQDKHYPEYLGAEVASVREISHRKLAYSDAEVLFSSNDTITDFDKFYPKSTCKSYVVQFAVTLPDFGNVRFEDVALKFNIKQPYFFSPNQFWSHKNHLTVIKAVELLKQQGIDTTVVFTGNEQTGGGTYVKELKEYVKQAGLEKNCLFLGFIERNEQLVLMKNAKAVIQPSMFEGWSTVVEDAKCTGKYLLLSDLNVHHEQISENVSFFSPKDETQLATIIRGMVNIEVKMNRKNYNDNLIAFAEGFISAVNKE
jgi:glycosyltransferase involved in cell wall biosynthesis